MATVKCEVWILVDADGEYVATHDEDAVIDLYKEAIDGELHAGCRRVKVTIEVPLPVQVELTGKVSEQEDAALTEAK